MIKNQEQSRCDGKRAEISDPGIYISKTVDLNLETQIRNCTYLKVTGVMQIEIG